MELPEKMGFPVFPRKLLAARKMFLKSPVMLLRNELRRLVTPTSSLTGIG